jgi:hypothetical protein
MEPLVEGDLRIDVEEPDPGRVILRWGGRSSDRQPGNFLGPFFEIVADRAKARKASVEMRFEDLEYFNSSTITALINFIQAARTKNLVLTFVFRSDLKWQKVSFDALQIFQKPDGLLMFCALKAE